MKRVVASLYVPLLSVALKSLPCAHLFSEQEKSVAPVTENGIVSSSVASAIANPVTSQLSVGNADSSFVSIFVDYLCCKLKQHSTSGKMLGNCQ